MNNLCFDSYCLPIFQHTWLQIDHQRSLSDASSEEALLSYNILVALTFTYFLCSKSDLSYFFDILNTDQT